ncbi:hypothetical protein [Chryseobacterium camelliae]|uniref:hypothetical protein n=1 Tax=Chryseobacterium camelliae TaxID=1265445 RepID=UPI00285790AC|nr:hypothetical protein [Chryseobacterium camelliae]MDR6513662.1 hypothetical protein [Chryseobacterium camelliae]
MMEHKIIKPDKDFELEILAKKSEQQLPYIAEEGDKARIYWHACPSFSPFMSTIDLSFAFDELKKKLKKWLEKSKKPIIYKNKANEAI